VKINLTVEMNRAQWIATAAYLIGAYGAMFPGAFLTQDVIPFATTQGLPEPTDRRLWGHATKRAVRAGKIKFAGYSPGNTGAVVSMWRAAA
jgi:hypothetical protein